MSSWPNGPNDQTNVELSAESGRPASKRPYKSRYAAYMHTKHEHKDRAARTKATKTKRFRINEWFVIESVLGPIVRLSNYDSALHVRLPCRTICVLASHRPCLFAAFTSEEYDSACKACYKATNVLVGNES